MLFQETIHDIAAALIHGLGQVHGVGPAGEFFIDQGDLELFQSLCEIVCLGNGHNGVDAAVQNQGGGIVFAQMGNR